MTLNQFQEKEDKEFESIWSEMAKEDRKYLLYPTIKSYLHSRDQRLLEKTLQECIDLSDKIELEQPDGEINYEWKAFKRFRNTLRDKIKELKL